MHGCETLLHIFVEIWAECCWMHNPVESWSGAALRALPIKDKAKRSARGGWNNSLSSRTIYPIRSFSPRVWLMPAGFGQHLLWRLVFPTRLLQGIEHEICCTLLYVNVTQLTATGRCLIKSTHDSLQSWIMNWEFGTRLLLPDSEMRVLNPKTVSFMIMICFLIL